MTLVEFFDKDSLENLCSCAAARADKVIFIGGDKSTADRYIAKYRKIFEARGVPIDFGYRVVDRFRLSSLVQALTKIVEDEPECAFDLTGGDDLCLVAVGMVHERNPHITIHRFNLQDNRIYDFDTEGNFRSDSVAPNLTADETVQAFGGDVFFDSEIEDGTHVWDLNDDFRQDILSMADLLWGRSAMLWNQQICWFKMMNDVLGGTSDLVLTVKKAVITAMIGQEEYENASWIPDVIRELERLGLVRTEETNEQVTVSFKNRQVKRALTKEGQALELVVYLLAKEAKRAALPVYNDVQTGVYIDWDGGKDTEVHNEIDVMMMHGMIPVFVSCKNGKVDVDELYKLDAVASRFGGKYAKRVLVATSLRFRANKDAIRQRAAEMQIHLIEPGNTDDLKRELAAAYALYPVV